jgi:hypothetical protein
MNTFLVGLRSEITFFFDISGFFGGVKQAMSRTRSIMNLRDGLTKWFLEGTEDNVVRGHF